MTEVVRHLHAVDAATGEVIPDGCPDCKALELELRGKRSQITKLKNENARLMGVEPEHDDILAVCEFWRTMLVPGASVTVASKGWLTVRARLREVHPATEKRVFHQLQLRAAVCGIALDEWHMDPKQRHRRYLENAFSDAGKVDRLIDLAIGFRQRKGVSALTLVEELGGTAFVYLADRCSCGGLRLDHLRGAGCGHFDELAADVERWMAQP